MMDVPTPEKDSKSTEHKPWLPEWMVHNMERLNTTTDFDQYACSVLEPEAYLSEGCQDDQCATSGNLTSGAFNQLNDELGFNSQKKTNVLPISDAIDKQLAVKKMQGRRFPVKHQLLIDAIKHEDIVYSSPDSTPCVTPEPSPAPRRKISLTKQDTVHSNPQKWFYLGTPKIIFKRKEALSKGNIDTTDSSDNTKGHGSNNTGVKLTISNFDLNAISPSSW